MKGGTYAAFEAIRQLLRAGALPTPLTVLLTPDEEIGSPSSRALIEVESARASHVLVPEPARAEGGVVSGTLRHRPLRPAGDRDAQPRRRPAGGRPLRHRRDGTADPGNRGDDDGGLHVQRGRHPWWPVG